MKNQIDILTFIDSPDIARHNEKTEFSPSEQAVLIGLSKRRTVEDKIKAWEYLLGSSPDERDWEGYVSCTEDLDAHGLTVRGVVTHKVFAWKEALSARYANELAVYEVILTDVRTKNAHEKSYCFFSTYQKAFDYMATMKQSVINGEDWSNKKTISTIRRIILDEADPKGECALYQFNDELDLVSICEPETRKYTETGVRVPDLCKDFYVRVPMPFKEGDVLRISSPDMLDQFGFLMGEFRSNSIDAWWGRGKLGSADMSAQVVRYDDKAGWVRDYYVFQLDLMSCTEDEEDVLWDLWNFWHEDDENLDSEDENYIG